MAVFNFNTMRRIGISSVEESASVIPQITHEDFSMSFEAIGSCAVCEYELSNIFDDESLVTEANVPGWMTRAHNVVIKAFKWIIGKFREAKNIIQKAISRFMDHFSKYEEDFRDECEGEGHGSGAERPSKEQIRKMPLTTIFQSYTPDPYEIEGYQCLFDRTESSVPKTRDVLSGVDSIFQGVKSLSKLFYSDSNLSIDKIKDTIEAQKQSAESKVNDAIVTLIDDKSIKSSDKYKDIGAFRDTITKICLGEKEKITVDRKYIVGMVTDAKQFKNWRRDYTSLRDGTCHTIDSTIKLIQMYIDDIENPDDDTSVDAKAINAFTAHANNMVKCIDQIRQYLMVAFTVKLDCLRIISTRALAVLRDYKRHAAEQYGA